MILFICDKNVQGMRLVFFISIVLNSLQVFCQDPISVVSWNLKDMGASKSETEVRFMAGQIKNYDVVAIQEVVVSAGGAQAVARLVDELNRSGNSWDYTVSDPTLSSGNKQERYAFVWKKSRLSKVGAAWLDKKYAVEMEREPYLITLKNAGSIFTLVSFHAITKTQQPETEIKYLKYFRETYPSLNLIFMGDFNCPESHSVFTPLKNMGYSSAIQNQKTSLKRSCVNSECLASEYDNIFYDSKRLKRIESGVIHFYKSFPSLHDAAKVSDHIPVFLKFQSK